MTSATNGTTEATTGTDEKLPTHHAVSALDQWAKTLKPIEKDILLLRISAHEKQTLSQIGEAHDRTRERIRQLETRILKQLQTFLNSPEAQPVRDLAEQASQLAGPAVPKEELPDIPGADHQTNAYAPLLLDLAGPYQVQEHWLVLTSSIPQDPLPRILEHADRTNGVINPTFAAVALEAWGLPQHRHRGWLARNGETAILMGRLVKLYPKTGDRIVTLLEAAGTPLTLHQIAQNLGETINRNTISNHTSEDDRLIRTGRYTIGLKTWNLPEYQTVALHLKEILDQNGPTHIDHLVDAMEKRYRTLPNTTRTYTEAPMFIAYANMVRNRTPEDPPFRYPPLTGPLKHRGIFTQGPATLVKLIKADRSTRRGSGLMLGLEAGNILGHLPNQIATYTEPATGEITITYPDTNFNGPSLSSIRQFLVEHNAQDGDIITLKLNANTRQAGLTLTRKEQIKPDWTIVAQLLSIPGQTADQKTLANALMCHPQQVWQVLNSRRDTTVMQAMPLRRGDFTPDASTKPAPKPKPRPAPTPPAQRPKPATDNTKNSERPQPKTDQPPERRRPPHSVRVVRHELPNVPQRGQKPQKDQ